MQQRKARRWNVENDLRTGPGLLKNLQFKHGGCVEKRKTNVVSVGGEKRLNVYGVRGNKNPSLSNTTSIGL